MYNGYVSYGYIQILSVFTFVPTFENSPNFINGNTSSDEKHK